jgi:hypothetical protein
MTTFFVILILMVVLFLIVAPIVYMQTRRVFREQKNYERGLKIVPILIHLPPISDDIELGGRDVRDVTEETISRAQIIYNIIASTVQKGFKSTFYGQRHFAFEIVGTQGFVYFYAAVPVTLVEVVKQAIISAYPSARLEEVAEHNIFNQVGKLNGTMGGELTLKESFAYPIATYQDLKRDGMQSLLNALSTLGKEDGAAIQLLMRPAHPSWRKTASSLASKKRKGTDKKIGAASLAKDVAVAFIKPPEGGKDDGGSSSKRDLSNLDQAILDAIDDKTRHPGFEVLIRVVVSSNISQQAQAILNNIVASFAIYDAPGKNGFKYSPAKDIDGLVTAYLMRFFPQQHQKDILNVIELATLFHFPDQRNIPTSQLTRQDSKQVDGPRNVPEEGLLLGYNIFRGAKKPIRLSLGDRQRHMYAVGQTGTGKSTFLENLALQDMLSGNGFAFVDPHGDTVENLLAMVPKERTEDVIYFSPAEMDYPMGLNLFEYTTPDQKDFLIQEVLNMLYKLYDPQHQGIMGPRYEDMFRNAALAIMADPNGGTFIEIPQLFRDPQFLKQKLTHVKDQTVLDFWQKQFPASQRSNESGEVTAWFVSKFGAFLSNEMMRNIIGQTKSSFDLRDIMDNKKILLVNLSKGRTGDLNSKLLGMIFVMKFQAAAMSRSNIPEDDRVDFSLYVDEFQNFSTDSFATIMSEARKYHLNLIVANQFTTQLTPEIRDAVFGNMGTIVSFRVGQNDVESLGKYFQPIFDADDLLRIPNYNTIVRTLIGGVPTQPFSMATLPNLGTPNPKLSAALKQLSAAKYGKPKAIVGADITARMRVPDAPKPASPFSPAASPSTAVTMGAGAASTPMMAPAPAAGAAPSFLDEWLNKRRTGQPSPSLSAVNAPRTPAPAPSFAPAPNVASVTASPAPATAAFTPAPTITPDVAAAPAVPPPPLTPAPIPSEPQGDVYVPAARNISSDVIEQNEVDKIAAELKQQLDSSMGSLKASAAPAAVSATQPEPVTTPADQAPSTAATSSEAVHTIKHDIGKDDTIFIDDEGTLHVPQDDK